MNYLLSWSTQIHFTVRFPNACCFSLHRKSTGTYDPELAPYTESIRCTIERNHTVHPKASTYKQQRYDTNYWLLQT